MKKIAMVLIISVLTAIVLTTCSDSLDEDTGNIIINLGLSAGGARSVICKPNDETRLALVYTITLTGNGEPITINDAQGGQTIQATVPVGLWDVELTAYYQDKVYATGANSVDVKAGQDNHVSIPMNRVEDGHLWSDWDVTIPPTCTEEGEGLRICVECGVEETEIPALGHDYQDWTQTTAPTCTAEGVETGICTRDQVTATRPAVIDPNAHDYAWQTTADPTFIEAGVETEICTHDPSHTRATRPSVLSPQKQIMSTADWNAACTQLNGKTGSYTLEIGADFDVGGTTTRTFGITTTGSLTLTINGNGRTISLSSPGSIFYIETNQNVTMNGLTLKGRTDNNTALVSITNNAAFTMNSGEISGNNATDGGGVRVFSGTFTMNGGEISGNTANFGGGVVSGGTFTMNNGEISGNNAANGGLGGGVYVSGIFTMYDGEISGNTYGGGVGVGGSGTFTMNGGEISGNTANTGYSGGGVIVYNEGTFTMNGGEISGNTAGSGGGVEVQGSGTFIMHGGGISGNTAGSGGGGVNVSGGIFTMNDGEISGNTATYNGGGVSVSYFGIFTMEGGKISGNTAKDGGGVYVSGTFTMNNGEISSNESTGISYFPSGGGGVYVENGTFTMNDGKISGNNAISGGGVSVAREEGTFIMNGGEIFGNTAFVQCGGVFTHFYGIFTMYGGKISGNIVDVDGEIPGNTTPGHGGGVLVSDGTFTMEGGEISRNTVAGGGGGVYINGGTFTMKGGGISRNTAGDGGGVSVSGGTFTMNSGEISGNTAPSDGGGVYVGDGGTFRIVTGTIYGSDTNEKFGDDQLKINAASRGGALCNEGSAKFGTFSGTTWTDKGNLETTDDTIKVVNGEITP